MRIWETVGRRLVTPFLKSGGTSLKYVRASGEAGSIYLEFVVPVRAEGSLMWNEWQTYHDGY
jgi:hypothetical protein